MKTQKRYEKFLLSPSEVIELPEDGNEGLNIVENKISELGQCENRFQNKIMECIFHVLVELFEITSIELQTTGFSNSFLLITTNETDFNKQEGLESPLLSREKLKGADAMEISGAIIDLFLERDTWNTRKIYTTLRLVD